jgi:N-acetylmuramoyl-L-alanine amidase
MSANPTRVDCDAAIGDLGAPLQEGNRVFDSIARQDGLRALHAFSDLHEQIRNRRQIQGCSSDQDLFETERFVLDEVLQLICARAQSITGADCVVVALAEELPAKQSKLAKSLGNRAGLAMVCRAVAGCLAIERGVPLVRESQFLQNCLESGRVLRSDDSATDTRVELDIARKIGARSSVLVPLQGRRQQLGVLQAFSRTPWSFTDQDVRSLILLAELLLAAVKPEDQDRRIDWLSAVADDVLHPKLPATAETAVAKAEALESRAAEPDAVQRITPPDADDLPQPGFELESEIPLQTEELWDPPKPVLLPLSNSQRSRTSSPPGLNVVMGLVAVAALFSVGTWWGMQGHGKTPATNTTAKGAGPRTSITAELVLSTNNVSPPSDNLMSSQNFGANAAPLAPVEADKLAALPKVTGVRHWSSSIESTVVIDMEDQVPYEVHRLTSPERIYFDLHDTVLASELDGKTMDVGDAALSRVRVAQPVAGVTRIVLDTKDGSNFSVSMESNPYRLVVELRRSDKASVASHFAAKEVTAKSSAAVDMSQGSPRTSPAPAMEAKVSAQPLIAKTGKFRIVLDAGHGGWDLGTVGREGLLEKDLVLDVTSRLGRLLQTRLGSEVMFTRTADTYLPLDQRADIANRVQADLFISVHANYSNSAAARGVETYYTNLFSAPGAREVERHEDGTFTRPTLISLSADGLHEKIEESRRLAASVQRSLYATLASSSPDIRNRGIKDSAFVVLTGTTMPSILTEISFVSSPADERNLQSVTYRQQIAEALYQGIARYEQSSPRAKVAQLQTTATRR